MRTVFIVLITLLVTSAAFAETAYVSDEFEITLRREKGPGKKILKMLPTGAKVDVTERDEEEGYALVTTDSGTEGWVLTRYLVPQPVAKDRLNVANQRIKDMRGQIKELQDRVKELESQNKSLETAGNKLTRDEAKLQKEIETIKKVSAEPLVLYEENQKLKSDLLTLQRDMQSLQQEKVNLEDTSAKNWFLIGGAVCIVGIIMGLMLPNLTGRRKSSWSSL